MLAVMLVGLQTVSLLTGISPTCWSYKRVSAVAADGNLGLVGVDEDLGVALGAAAAVAGGHTLVRPRHGDLVNHFHGGKRLWLVN